MTINGDSAPEPQPAELPGGDAIGNKGCTRLRVFEPPDRLSFALTTIVVLSVYWWTLAPSVTLEWSGLLCTSAMYTGVGPPPGYPLWTIYAWLFTLLPISNIAWRVAFSSAVAGALCCGLIALMASRAAGAIAETFTPKLAPKQAMLLRVVAGYVAGGALAFDGCFWDRAVIVDTWAFSLLLLCVALGFLVRWFYASDRKRWLYLGCLFYGLTVSNSQALFAAGLGLQLLIMFGKPALGRDIFFANCLLGVAGFLLNSPVLNIGFLLGLVIVSLLLCVVLIVATRRFLTEWRTVLCSGLMFSLGLSAYLYLPIASMTNPPVNWGYPRTVQGFFHVLTRGQYERLHPIDTLRGLRKALSIYAKVAAKEFGWIYVTLALVPFCFLHRMRLPERQLMLGLFAVFFCLAVLLLIVINPATDRQSVEMNRIFFSASHMILALLAGIGIVVLGSLISSPRSAESA